MPYNHTEPNIARLTQALSARGIAHAADPATRASKAHTPQSPAAQDEIPAVVFFPCTTADVSAILGACNAARVAVTAFSGGTSFGGALAAARGGGVCVCFERMAGVLRVNEADMDCVVQAGCGWVELNERVRGAGLFFPVDPAPGACVGGMVGMSCSGTNAYAYGTMKEWVVALTVVLADGTVLRTRRRPRKSAAGYDLTRLLIGSEGTLGLVTEAVLRLAALPRNLHVGLATFGEFQHGVDVVVALQKLGHRLEALELADGPQMHAINASGLARRTFEEKPTLWLKFAGSSAQVVRDQIRAVEKLCEAQRALSFEVTADEKRIDILWGARKCIGHALVAMKKQPSDLFMHSDCAVPISNLAALVAGTQDLIDAANAANAANQASGTSRQPWFCANVGHVGDGNVHSAIICPVEDKQRVEEVLIEVARLALRLDGTVTGEHGVGLKQREALVEEVGEEGVEVMRRVKMALDPRGILNPDKVFRLERGEESVSRAKL
jgi:D-lactate dehydrogenase (cytochrome)